MRWFSSILVMLVALAAPAAAQAQLPADPADQPPFDGGRAYQLSVPPAAKPPSGFRLDSARVTAIATGSIGSELARRAQRVRVRTRVGTDGEPQWQVDLFEPEGKDI